MRLLIPRNRLLLLAVLALGACADDDPEPTPPAPPPEPLFPANVLETFQEVRDCRPSSEHDLGRVRVFADSASLGPYTSREGEFAEGATLVKVEYDGTDAECAGEITQWTVMQRLAAGSSEDTLGWRWQRVNSAREVVTENDRRCVSCHTGCNPPEGFFNTCALP